MDEWILERYELAAGRVREIAAEETVVQPYRDYFQKTAGFLSMVLDIREDAGSEKDLETLQRINHRLYQDILPENYPESYGNPAFAAEKLGEYGEELSFLYAELRGCIAYAYEQRIWDLTVGMELFLEMYSAFCNEELPRKKEVRAILVSYVNDYCQEMMEDSIAASVDPGRDFLTKIVMESDFSDLRYLYRSGEYVGENELRMARFLSTMDPEKLESMARTYTEGFRIGFELGRKDLSIKKTVNLHYRLGFEPMIRCAVRQFAEMGLVPVIYRYATHYVAKRNHHRRGFEGGNANPQFEYDHRQDCALFLDSDFCSGKLRAIQNAYEKYKVQARELAGPAVIETFGETEFVPVSKPEALSLSETQKKLQVEMDNESGQITNRYIPGDERSFTIIAYPLPEIGDNFEEIFEEIVKVNTLDYLQYRRIQQTMIEALDTCEWVEIQGAPGNETALRVHLHELTDITKQTNFENCVADVNIPVGEVFTSPLLKGTDGVLHVSRVYLNGLLFLDLKIVFRDGQVAEYSCGNFASEEENRKYIEDNILFHHEGLPMGEFAIGTNTTAYVMAQKYGIAGKLPILIAEKMGPHFAVGDTCYSWSEDNAVYNPDGREIIARDNEISMLRKVDISRAYYGCHTDITIPYDELGSIQAVRSDGEKVLLIQDGRFVLPGTEELNEPFFEEK